MTIKREVEGDEWAGFLDRLVHDLREPLRSVTVFTELLAEIAGGRLGVEGDRVTTEILGGAARMGALLESLSAYSLALRETPDPAAVTSLQSAFNLVAGELEEQIRAEGATVSAAGLPKVTLSLERSMDLLRQLIGNSLRFHAEEPAVIRLSAAGGPGDLWTISVADNGIGIEPGDREAVFLPFMRVQGKKYPGVGLGLSICRKIVEGHGGTIHMEPAPEGGNICVFTLPG
jgi:light-regulated signal transduction histidine kinase (bacteriophytochrome)